MDVSLVVDPFSWIMDDEATNLKKSNILKVAWVDTPLGQMIAIADEKALYLLEFVDSRGLERKVARLRKRTGSVIIRGYTQAINSVESELKMYFEGLLVEFKTSLFFLGSPFQKGVWEELKKIPSGETRSYSEIATAIGRPTAFRAVANANGANQFVLIIPCHRVTSTNGRLGGYSGGLARKRWLINHEKEGV